MTGVATMLTDVVNACRGSHSRLYPTHLLHRILSFLPWDRCTVSEQIFVHDTGAYAWHKRRVATDWQCLLSRVCRAEHLDDERLGTRHVPDPDEAGDWTVRYGSYGVSKWDGGACFTSGVVGDGVTRGSALSRRGDRKTVVAVGEERRWMAEVGHLAPLSWEEVKDEAWSTLKKPVEQGKSRGCCGF